ncbi:MAG: NAD-dependent epimerase/dehydratase family protein [Nitrososphaeraceae archaeon]
MTIIGIVGARGFLGSTLCKAAKSYNFQTIEITRENYDKYKREKFDILINSASPSKKYWALKNPYLDFQATVMLTADLTYNWNYEKLVQMSSMSVNDEKSKHPYTINKKAAEIITSYKNSLIIRLSNLYGDGLSKGPLFDLLNSRRIYVDIKSEYSFISTDFVAKWIFDNLDRDGVVQVGARDTISLLEISKILGLKAEWEGNVERIHSSNVEEGMPYANEVLKFANQYVKNS